MHVCKFKHAPPPIPNAQSISMDLVAYKSEGSNAPQKLIPDFEISGFRERFWDFSLDFVGDFKISLDISGFS